jgi:AAA15 family ATPase/GTPase
MHINRLEIENFKGISKLDLEPSKINLFVGRNNTCKSTILESIALAGTANNGYVDALHEDILTHLIESRLNLQYWIKKGTDSAIIRYDKANMSDSILLNYVERGIPPEYDDICRSIIMRDVERRAIIEYRRASRYYGRNRIIHKSPDEDIPEYDEFIKNLFEERYQALYNEKKLFLKQELNNRLTLIYNHIGYISKHSFIDDEASNLFYYSWSYRLSLLELYNMLVKKTKLLKYIIEQLGLYDIRSIGNTLYIYETDQEEPIPIEFMGDGSKTILKISMLSNLAENGILILEEPEATLHPGYIDLAVEHLVKAAKENNTQLFISTHSSEFIRSMLEYAGEDIRVFRMHKKGDDIDYTIFEGEEAIRKVKEIEIDLRGI